MLERQIVELLACQECSSTDVQTWHVTRHAHRFVPSLAIVNHVPRVRRAEHSFEVAPEANAVGEAESLSIGRGLLSVLLPKRLIWRPSLFLVFGRAGPASGQVPNSKYPRPLARLSLGEKPALSIGT